MIEASVEVITQFLTAVRSGNLHEENDSFAGPKPTPGQLKRLVREIDRGNLRDYLKFNLGPRCLEISSWPLNSGITVSAGPPCRLTPHFGSPLLFRTSCATESHNVTCKISKVTFE